MSHFALRRSQNVHWQAVEVDKTLPPRKFRRGDINNDLKVDLSDVIGVLGGLFLGQVGNLDCENAADMNGDGKIDLADAVMGLSYLFMGGAALPPPNKDAGFDPFVNALMCLK